MLLLLNRNNSTEWRSVMQELALHKEEVERLRDELEEVKLACKQEAELLRDQVA
jgi:signal recognition particle subunit SEC65